METMQVPTADPQVMRLECLRLTCGMFSGKEPTTEEVLARAKAFSEYVLLKP